MQYSVTVPEEEYNEMVGKDVHVINPGKNKILIQALDVSGSMSGAPIDALKIGAQLIGDKYYGSEEKPFEQFHTFLYNSQAKGFCETSIESYKNKISSIRAGGGTDFMPVFKEIEQILALNPKTDEIVVIFITDGQDGY